MIESMSTLIDIKELSSKSSEFKPGSTILLKDGTYSGLSIKITSKGSDGKRIYIKPQNPGKVILTGSSRILMESSHVTLANLVLKDGGSSKPAAHIKGNNNRITGFDVSYSESSTDQMFRIEGKYNRIDHNIFHDWDKNGVWVVVWRPNKEEDYALIDHNIFKNRISNGEDNGLECVRIGTSTDSLTNSKSLVYANQFINCNGEIEVISNKAGENIYYKNYMENSEGTLTLRHGNSCIVYKNHIDQKNKEESGGIRITGEKHIVANNLFKNINGNGTTRVGISINNGVKDSELNEYFQVKNTQIKNNIFINCSNDFAVGVKVKSESELKPIDSEISGTISFNPDNDDERFSDNSKVLGSDDMKYINNIFYAKEIGKVPKTEGIKLINPSEFDLPSFEQKISGIYKTETGGPDWTKQPEDTEIKISSVQYYNDLKNQILNEISSHKSLLDESTTPDEDTTPDDEDTTPDDEDTTPDDEDTTPDDDGNDDDDNNDEKITINKEEYDRLIKIEEYAKNIIPHLISLQKSIFDVSPHIGTLQDAINN